mmetsp:Transcript_61688/g.178938  ORF Transcript_61688/g.178938 Transcript_61688/m.178938 type:complete len:198 (-) Transcript_61688:269-862(-)
MEVVLEKIPQDGQIGPMQVVHWAIRVGSGEDSTCYEFESEGIQIGSHTTCDHGFKIKRQRLGTTRRSHEQIRQWVSEFGSRHPYHVAGADLGAGRNCQDFVVELCAYLGVDSSKLPWRQARVVEAAAGGAAVAVGVVAVVGSALLRYLCRETGRDDSAEIPVGHARPVMGSGSPWSQKQRQKASEPGDPCDAMARVG